MQVTVTLDDELVATAVQSSGLSDMDAMLREALCTMVARDAARKMARMAAAMADQDDIPRRRFHVE